MIGPPQLTLEESRLKVSGDITPDNALAIRKEGERLLRQSAGNDMIIDVSGLGAAHSVVLSLLLCWFRIASACHLTLRLEGVEGKLLSLASLSGLDDHLPGLEPATSHA